jgi:hypothetical protein
VVHDLTKNKKAKANNGLEKKHANAAAGNAIKPISNCDA